MLKYRLVSLIVGFGMGLLTSYLIYSMNHEVRLFNSIMLFFSTFLGASMVFTYLQAYDARKKNTPLLKADIAKIRKQRLLIIAAWFVAIILIYANDFGKFSVSLFTLYFSTLVAVVVHYFFSNRTYSAAIEAAKERWTRSQAYAKAQEQKKEESRITSENWAKFSTETEKRMAERRVRSVVQFFKEISQHEAFLKEDPLRAASYPYIVEYLPYSKLYSQRMADLKKKCLTSSTASLVGEFDSFINKHHSLSEGYYERKAAHEQTLKSSSAVSGVNDI
ncbi:hypothetical protein [Rosenbergiella collisarenosi]|uniref:hypothetical protein n=1 Tax=Rosenbergiella collisarenosi TaxID=1544695 RepID=UPI001F4FAFD5|nr:hypothetical protein [Rosenbergiella collisarenosi]